MYNKKIKIKPAKCQKIIRDNCAILVKKEAGLFLACFICFTTGMCQLVSAGSLLHTAVDAVEAFDHGVDVHALDELGNCL